MNKKGSLFDIIEGMTQFFISLILVLIGGLLIVVVFNSGIFSSGASQEIIATANYEALPKFDFIPVMIFFGFILGTIALAFFLRTSPLFFPINLLFLILVFILSIPIHNAWEAFRNSATGEILTVLNTFTLSNFLMSNLPTIIFIYGIIFLLVLFFVKPTEEVTDSGI